MSISEIPSYFRYGEDDSDEDVDMVYCQPIFSRISQQNWEIRPHRHNHLCQYFLLAEGKIDAVLELKEISLIGPCVLVVPSGKIHGFSYGDGAKGTMISVSDGFLRRVVEPGGQRLASSHGADAQLFDFVRHDDLFQKLRELFRNVESETEQRKPGCFLALAALLQLITLELSRFEGGSEAVEASDTQAACFARFRGLVSENMRSHWSVTQYCRSLGTGERRLNRICRAVVGESPLAYIHRQVIEEAKRSLVHTAMPVTSIGYELGFIDSAYFSRFFKKHTGESPSAFAARYRG